jgi:hypothetical protein
MRVDAAILQLIWQAQRSLERFMKRFAGARACDFADADANDVRAASTSFSAYYTRA